MTSPERYPQATTLSQACSCVTFLPHRCYTLRSFSPTGSEHLAGRSPVAELQPQAVQVDPSSERSRLPDQPPVYPANSHSLREEAPVALHSAPFDVAGAAETSPVSPELAGGPLGYRDKKAPAWPGRGAATPIAAIDPSGAGMPVATTYLTSLIFRL